MKHPLSLPETFGALDAHKKYGDRTAAQRTVNGTTAGERGPPLRKANSTNA